MEGMGHSTRSRGTERWQIQSAQAHPGGAEIMGLHRVDNE